MDHQLGARAWKTQLTGISDGQSYCPGIHGWCPQRQNTGKDGHEGSDKVAKIVENPIRLPEIPEKSTKSTTTKTCPKHRSVAEQLVGSGHTCFGPAHGRVSA